MSDKESFEDFSARVLPMWSCCPFHKNGGDTEAHCSWRAVDRDGQRELAELAQHADHLNSRIVALDDELQKYRALVAKIMELDDMDQDFAEHGFGDFEKADRLRNEIFADAKALAPKDVQATAGDEDRNDYHED